MDGRYEERLGEEKEGLERRMDNIERKIGEWESKEMERRKEGRGEEEREGERGMEEKVRGELG